jgi:hypothetical protein
MQVSRRIVAAKTDMQVICRIAAAQTEKNQQPHKNGKRISSRL